MSVYNEIKWGVHVVGPDNVLAARSFEEAVEKCDEINKALLAFSESVLGRHNFNPVVFAKVEMWEAISNAPHNPDESDWDNACA